MSGPWLGLCKFLGGEVGKKMGRVVTGDLKRWEAIPGWTHAVKIEELAHDKGLDPSYLKDLVKDSSKKPDLEAIEAYITDPFKAAGLGDSARKGLLKMVREKISVLEDQEILRGILDKAKEKGLSSLGDIFSHLI